MKEHSRYHFQGESALTVMYEFDTEDEMKASGFLDDPRRTTCFMSSGKYYVGGHFDAGPHEDKGGEDKCRARRPK